VQTRPSSRDRIARYRTAQRERGLRAVTLWLPDLTDPGYRARLADECRRLAQMTDEEAAIAGDFAQLAGPARRPGCGSRRR
jgi:Protein  of unknown function (DUF3018)